MPRCSAAIALSVPSRCDEISAFAKKQFVRQELLFASENRLAAKEYLRIQVFGHVGSDAFARESMAVNCIDVCMESVIGA